MPAHIDHPVPLAPPALLDTMRAWRTAHPAATFADIEREAMRQVAPLGAELIAAALETDTDAAPSCPDCGRTMARNGTRSAPTSAPSGGRALPAGAPGAWPHANRRRRPPCLRPWARIDHRPRRHVHG